MAEYGLHGHQLIALHFHANHACNHMLCCMQTVIQDDEYVSISSANLNQCSLDGSRDTELGMGSWQPAHTLANAHMTQDTSAAHGQPLLPAAILVVAPLLLLTLMVAALLLLLTSMTMALLLLTILAVVALLLLTILVVVALLLLTIMMVVALLLLLAMMAVAALHLVAILVVVSWGCQL